MKLPLNLVISFLKKSLSLVIASLILCNITLASNTAYAVVLAPQDSTYYLPGIDDQCTATGPVGLPSGLDLDSATLERIRTAQPVLEKVGQKYNFPWQILAALLYRETSGRIFNPNNGQGVWQLYSLTRPNGELYFEPSSTISMEEFERQTEIMVQWFFTGEKLDNALNHTLGDLQNIFARYNGFGPVAQIFAYYNAKKAGFNVDRSDRAALLNWNTYGMNQFDSNRINMMAKRGGDVPITTEQAESAAISILETGVSNNPNVGPNSAIGAVSVYRALGGPINGTDNPESATTQPPFTANPSSGAGKIYVIGDSLTVGMESYLNNMIGNSLVSPIQATVGDTIQDSTDKVDFDSSAETALVGLGTNNFNDSEDDFRSRVNTMIDKMRSINPSIRIYWTNIYAPREDVLGKYQALNEILEETARFDPNTFIIDWASEAQENGYTFPDELHPAEYHKRAQFIVSEMGASNNDPRTGNCTVGGSGNGAVQGSIVMTALNLSWTESDKVEVIRANRNNNPTGCSMRGSDINGCGRSKQAAGALNGMSDAKPEYVEALLSVHTSIKSDNNNWPFSDCGVFVSTVMRISGVDAGYSLRGTTTQLDYVKGSDKYDVIAFTDTAQLQPGDVLIKSGHTRIYVGQNDISSQDVAEASWGMYVPSTLWNARPEHSNPNDISGASGYIIARMK